MTLVIEPNEKLQFYGPRNENLSSTLKLKNEDSSGKILAVRLNTNKSNCLSVKQNKFLVASNDLVSLAVYLKPLNMNESHPLKIKVLSCAFGSPHVSYDLFDLMWKQAENFRQIETKCIEISYFPTTKTVSFAPLVNVISEATLAAAIAPGRDYQALTLKLPPIAIMTQEPLNEASQGGNELKNDNVVGEDWNAPANEATAAAANNDGDWGDDGAAAAGPLNEVEGQEHDVNNNQDVDGDENNNLGVQGQQQDDWNDPASFQPPAEQNNQAQVAVNHAFNEEMASANAPTNQWDYQGSSQGFDAWGSSQADNAGFNENDLQGAEVEEVVNPFMEALFVMFVVLVLGILIGKTAV